MKSKKWIWVTLTIILTLVVLVGVAGAGYRMGVMQSVKLVGNTNGTSQQFPFFGHMRGFNNQPGGNPGMMQGFDQRGFGMMRGFEHGGFKNERGGFFSPIFGLIKLAVLGLLLWFGFKLIKSSGWRITRVTQPAPVTNDSPKVEEKKDEA